MYKRILYLLVCFLLMFPLFCQCISAAPVQKTENWYMKHNGNHTTPVCDPRFGDIEKLGAYYLGPERSGDKTIYLTFDIGYVNESVIEILDILQEENVPAAFFVLKNVAIKTPEILNRMVKDGHVIGNHTANHKNVATLTEQEFCQEVQQMADLCQSVTGKPIDKFFRPPEGSFHENSLLWAKEMGYTTVFWSFAYWDWDNQKQPSLEGAKNKILSNIHPREILLLHPTSKTNAAILKEIIRSCKEQGYSFGTLYDLLEH